MPVRGPERRSQERFSMAVLAQLTIGTGEGAVQIATRTRDVSSAGALVEASPALSSGTRVTVDLFLTPKAHPELGAQIHVAGRVIRSTSGGVAIAFSKGFRISSRGSLADQRGD